MKNKLKITIAEYQRDLLLKHVGPYFLDDETERAISTALSKNGMCHIRLKPIDLEDMIGNCCFVANHEENKHLAFELDDLIDNLECVLDNG